MSETVATLIKLQSLDNDMAMGKVEVNSYRKRRRQELMGLIPEGMAKTYTRVRMRHQNAVVPVEEGVCQGCYVQIPAAVMGRLQNPREQVYCDHCGRILYLPQ